MDDIHVGRRPCQHWTSVARGLHVAGDLPETPLQAWSRLLPKDAAFTHLTAARLRGWWLPELPPGLPVLIAGDLRDVLNRPGIRVCRHRTAPESEELDGLRVATPTETILACARDLALLDLVVVAESALAAQAVDLGELAEVAAKRRRGAVKLRAALPWLDGRAESPWEVLLRVLHVSGGVDVVPQHEIVDDGTFVARGDLWIRGTRTLAEYDGEVHRDRRQHHKDLARDRRLLSTGWTRNGYAAQDVRTKAILILQDAYDALGWTGPIRFDAWQALWHPSAFNAYGRRLLLERLASPGRKVQGSSTS